MTPVEIIRDQIEIYLKSERDWEERWENRNTPNEREYAWRRMEESFIRRDALEWILGRIERGE